jgi:hypothetical protein
VDSPLAEFSFRTTSGIFPRHARRLSGHDPASALLDFSRPRGFNLGEVVRGGIVQTRQKFGCDIGALRERQGQRFTKKFLRSRRHVAILDPVAANPRVNFGGGRPAGLARPSCFDLLKDRLPPTRMFLDGLAVRNGLERLHDLHRKVPIRKQQHRAFSTLAMLRESKINFD